MRTLKFFLNSIPACSDGTYLEEESMGERVVWEHPLYIPKLHYTLLCYVVTLKVIRMASPCSRNWPRSATLFYGTLHSTASLPYSGENSFRWMHLRKIFHPIVHNLELTAVAVGFDWCNAILCRINIFPLKMHWEIHDNFVISSRFSSHSMPYKGSSQGFYWFIILAKVRSW